MALGAPGVSGQALGADMPIMRPDIFTYVVFDELEYFATGGEQLVEYDGELWIGGDIHRLWLKGAGEQATAASDGFTELQALYSRALTSFWNLQAGVRVDHRYGDGTLTRGHLGAGLEGIAPYWFEVEAFGFVSQDGDVSARLEASYDLRLTQRLAVESEVETSLAFQAVEEWGLGQGINDIELGSRIRYEFVREFAPYVGYSWMRLVGPTADLARAAGRETGHGAVVLGLHWWW
jgi:copper resistance protein B